MGKDRRSLPRPAAGAPLMEPAACPWLGLHDDPATHAQASTAGHRCFRDDPREYVVAEGHQRQCCVTADFTACPGFKYGWRSFRERSEKRRLPSYLVDTRRNLARPLFVLGVGGVLAFIVAYAVLATPMETTQSQPRTPPAPGTQPRIRPHRSGRPNHRPPRQASPRRARHLRPSTSSGPATLTQ